MKHFDDTAVGLSLRQRSVVESLWRMDTYFRQYGFTAVAF